MHAIARRPLTAVALTAALVGGGLLIAHAPTAHADTSCSQSYEPLPDPSCTPGTFNSDVTQSTIDSTICVSGWTSTIRPPSSYTTALKKTQIVEYGYSDTSPSSYEEDHFIPLELGGNPTDPANLWPQPHSDPNGDGYGSSAKDAVENKLKTAVCNGTVTLADAQNAIQTDWTTAESVLGLS